jgi:hypothetical protein
MASSIDHQPTIHIDTDLVVVGGGMAGVCAALGAARNGIKVVLVQDRSVLGGNASSEVKMHIVGADCHGYRHGARESGLIEELRLEDSFRNPNRSYAQWDLLLYEKVKAEQRITLLLDTDCIGCTTDPDTKRILSVLALRNCTEDRFDISARFFADCSGDSRLGYEAGADYRMGREGREEYGESLACSSADACTLGSSILLTARHYDAPQPFYSPSWTRKFTKQDLKHRAIYSYEYGYWWFEWGGQKDVIKDNEVIRHELLRIAYGIWDYVKNSGDHPDSANWALDWVGAIPGKRESRRLLGPHVLTQNDLQSGRIFHDAVAYGGWAIDLHPPAGIDAVDEPPFTPTQLAQLYTIPFRSLYSRNVPNLLFAGRNISATHVAFASTRVMATCSAMGQAIGTAAAIAIEEKTSLVGLSSEPHLETLQQRLLRDDAFIPTIQNADPSDRAVDCAALSASSSATDCNPSLVVDGISRDLIGNLGPWADGKPHHWASQELPAWIELRFPAPIEVSEIHLTFNSGFQRQLTLSPSDHTTSQVIRGPQPELVKSYRIHAGGRQVVEETGNYLRKRVHRLPTPILTDSVQIEVLQTHGVASAHIFEVRVYCPKNRLSEAAYHSPADAVGGPP